MSLDEYEAKIDLVFGGYDTHAEVAPIVRAAVLLSTARRISGGVWNPWARERARQLSSRARVLADELVGGDAEEKVTEWAARESEEWARKIERHRA